MLCAIPNPMVLFDMELGTSASPNKGVPKVSVVIASHNCAAMICQCLTALEAQAGREQAEVILVDASTDGTSELVSQSFPWVRVLRPPGNLTIPYLRGEGIAAASGDILAVLDPYCIVDQGWLKELLKVHAVRPEVAIGGSVEPGEPGEPDNLGVVGWGLPISPSMANSCSPLMRGIPRF